jgi:hypothetical protein
MDIAPLVNQYLGKNGKFTSLLARTCGWPQTADLQIAVEIECRPGFVKP